jgi:dynein heavy chain
MPRKEKFGAQPALEILRQWCDYEMWYELHKQQQRLIVDMQLLAAMGPPGGARSKITNRLLTRTNLINFTFPDAGQIKLIFLSIIMDRLSGFSEDVKPLGEVMTLATIDVYKIAVEEFLPTPAKSHYLFNMRDISKVFQGLLRSDRTFYDTRDPMIKLWVHECMRVFHDRLIDVDDRTRFKAVLNNKLTGMFASGWAQLFGEAGRPLFADFISDELPVPGSTTGETSRAYVEIVKKAEAKRILTEKIEELNMEVGAAPMDLVLFEDAIEHVVRIYRVLVQPRGNLMLVGVGGSGRQSLTRYVMTISLQPHISIPV